MKAIINIIVADDHSNLSIKLAGNISKILKNSDKIFNVEARSDLANFDLNDDLYEELFNSYDIFIIDLVWKDQEYFGMRFAKRIRTIESLSKSEPRKIIILYTSKNTKGLEAYREADDVSEKYGNTVDFYLEKLGDDSVENEKKIILDYYKTKLILKIKDLCYSEIKELSENIGKFEVSKIIDQKIDIFGHNVDFYQFFQFIPFRREQFISDVISFLSKALKRTVLVITTEWDPLHGGVSKFNKHLCKSLAQNNDFNVFCYVLKYTDTEYRSAKRMRVTLKKVEKKLQEYPIELLTLMPNLTVKDYPDIIIGHDRITGEYASYHKRKTYPRAKSICFIHTPYTVNYFKRREKVKVDLTKKIEKHRDEIFNVCKDQDIIVAVGPRNRDHIETILNNRHLRKKIVEFNPPFFKRIIMKKKINRELNILFISRGEDSHLKNINLVIQSVGKYFKEFPNKKITLNVRGVDIGTENLKQESLATGYKFAKTKLHVLSYNSNETQIERDFQEADLLLMPSLLEGFGLVALEALNLGIPILISSESGFAELIREKFGVEIYNKHAIKVTGNDDPDIELWAHQIKYIMENLDLAKNDIKILQKLYSKTISWEDEISKFV